MPQGAPDSGDKLGLGSRVGAGCGLCLEPLVKLGPATVPERESQPHRGSSGALGCWGCAPLGTSSPSPGSALQLPKAQAPLGHSLIPFPPTRTPFPAPALDPVPRLNASAHRSRAGAGPWGGSLGHPPRGGGALGLFDSGRLGSPLLPLSSVLHPQGPRAASQPGPAGAR